MDLAHPRLDEFRQPMERLPSKEHLINVPHVKHVDHTAKVGATTFPPSEPVIEDEVVLNMNPFALTKLLELHAVQECFIHAIGYATAEGRRVVILLDLPERNRIDG